MAETTADQILPQILIRSSSIYRTHLYRRCHIYFMKSFDVVTFQALVGIEFITWKFSSNCALLKYVKNNLLGVRLPKLNQQQLLSCAESNHLLASHRSLLCWLWWLQRPPQVVNEWWKMLSGKGCFQIKRIPTFEQLKQSRSRVNYSAI